MKASGIYKGVLKIEPLSSSFLILGVNGSSVEESVWISPPPWCYEPREKSPDCSLLLFILGEHTDDHTGQRAMI